MPEVYRAAPATTELENAQSPPRVVAAPRPPRRELLISFVAAVAVLVVAGVLLAMLIGELRGGWVPDHERPMDKATAVHKLLFRP